jgi:HEPN domain-containing protein/predicted nucleotidyltransferase
MSIRTPRASLVDEIAERIPDAPAGVGPSREAIAEVVSFIADRFRPERIVLFGSRAYGVPAERSDVDLMVVMDRQDRTVDHAAAIRAAVRATLPPPPLGVRYDVKTRTPEQIRIGLAERDFFLLDVMVLGVTLYAKDGTSMTETPPEGGSSPAGEPPRLTRATSEWLAKADSDLQLAERAAGPPHPLWDGVCFHAQQFTEKYLKALLQERNIRHPLTHDLSLLAALAAGTAPDLGELHDDLTWLTEYAVDIRYPGKFATAADGERALHVATEVRDVVSAALGLDEATG